MWGYLVVGVWKIWGKVRGGARERLVEEKGPAGDEIGE